MSEKRIFITGGAGFIGINFVKYLLDKGGFKITVNDNLTNGSRNNLNNALAMGIYSVLQIMYRRIHN